ncbi:MAG: fimbria/pilus periplasmic chaperone [Halioglobus sp.]
MIVLTTLTASEVAKADLLLDKVVVIFDESKSTKKDVSVINDDSDERLFVSVEPFEVEAPGTEDQTLKAVAIDDNPAFLATPSKLIVEPGSSSVVRLLNLQPESTQERVYRINFLPIQKPPEIDNDVNDGVAPMVEILVAYQVLAIVLPPNPEPKPVVTRTGNVISFSNQGNANYLLTDGKQCNPIGSSKCVDLPGHRVYAGSSWSVELPFDGPAQYGLRTQSGTRALIVE